MLRGHAGELATSRALGSSVAADTASMLGMILTMFGVRPRRPSGRLRTAEHMGIPTGRAMALPRNGIVVIDGVREE